MSTHTDRRFDALSPLTIDTIIATQWPADSPRAGQWEFAAAFDGSQRYVASTAAQMIAELNAKRAVAVLQVADIYGTLAIVAIHPPLEEARNAA